MDYVGGIMMFPDSNTGYAVNVNIYKTTNFGVNWITQINPIMTYLNSVYFPSVNIGYCCGQSSSILKTTNGGNNWNDIITPCEALFNLNGVFFIDSVKGFLVGGYIDTGVIQKTTNGGLNWNMKAFSLELNSIFFVNSNTGIVGSIGCILKTVDGGLTWNLKNLPDVGYISSLYFPGINTGFGVCQSGVIIKTNDGGETWFKQYSGTTYNLKSVYFINNYTGYVCGDGIILKTTNGGGPPIGIKLISNYFPNEYKLYQNYPNPFNPSTKINFNLSKKVFVRVIIYDLQGKLIDEPVNFELDAGTYSMNWNGANFSSGVYFYKLIAGDFTQTKRMVLLK